MSSNEPKGRRRKYPSGVFGNVRAVIQVFLAERGFPEYSHGIKLPFHGEITTMMQYGVSKLAMVTELTASLFGTGTHFAGASRSTSGMRLGRT